jgi:hypothetical protein
MQDYSQLRRRNTQQFALLFSHVKSIKIQPCDAAKKWKTAAGNMILRIKFNPIGGKTVIAILGATGGLFGASPHSALLRYTSLRAFPCNPWRWISLVKV